MVWAFVVLFVCSFVFLLLKFWVISSSLEKQRDAAIRREAQLRLSLASRDLYTHEDCDRMKEALRLIEYDMSYCQRGCPNSSQSHFQAIIRAEKIAHEALKGVR